jgi:hypothetical protein
LSDRIIGLANEALTAELGLRDSTTWGIGPGQVKSAEGLLDAIDRGSHPGGRDGREFLERSFFSSVLFSFSGEQECGLSILLTKSRGSLGESSTPCVCHLLSTQRCSWV